MSKWVICFDLFGTLIAAPSDTPSYEDLLVQAGCNKEFVQAYVRRHFMTGPAHELDYLEMANELCRAVAASSSMPEPEEVARLWEAENKALKWLPKMKEEIEHRLVGEDGVYVLVTNVTHMALKEPIVQEAISHFDDVYLSCRELCAKPDPYVWQAIMHRHPNAERYFMHGDSELGDLAIPAKMGWTVSDPRFWIDPDDVCHQEYVNEDNQPREAVSVGRVYPR